MSKIASLPRLVALVFALALTASLTVAGVLGSATESTAADGKKKGGKLDDGLVGYWKFDESGDKVVDSSGKNNNGVFINSTLTSGRNGQVLSVSGDNNSHVSVPATPSLHDFDDKITVTAWVYPTIPVTAFRVIVSRQIAELLHPDQFFLGFGTEDGVVHYKWHLGTLEDGKVNDNSIYTGTPATNRWLHLAGTYDGRVMRLYVDGAKIGEKSATGKIQVDDNPVTIGAEENGAESHVVESDFTGQIDEVRIYNRALSPKEIKQIYRRSKQ